MDGLLVTWPFALALDSCTHFFTGGHNWFPFSSKAKQFDDGSIQVLRYGAWVTSAGFADFYVVESTSPSYGGDFMNLSLFLMFKVRVVCFLLRTMLDCS